MAVPVVSAQEAMAPPALRTRSRSACPLCGSAGTVLHAAVRDLAFGVPGEWSLRRCVDPACGLVWQDPMVIEEDLVHAYRDYYTRAAHDDGNRGTAQPGNAFFRLDRALERGLGLGAERLRHAAAYLDTAAPGALLDVGCGDGAFAAAMRDRGWNASGTEFDPAAAEGARRRHGLRVEVGELRSLAFASRSFDAVTARHVVEHVSEPAEFLAECWRLVRPGGRLVVVTPNVASLGHRRFGACWRGLEQPRHLHLFDTVSMAALGRRAGIAPARVFTTAQGASFVLHESLAPHRGPLRRALDALEVAWLTWREVVQVRGGAPVGEELVLAATKESST